MKKNKTNDFENEVVITPVRRACNGTCPVYKPTLYGNGRSAYEGETFVRVIGRKTFTISETRIRMLISFIDGIGFLSLKESYEEGVIPDMATAVTSITINAKTKSVRHFYGDPNAPKELTRLEHMIDKTVNPHQWVK
jgi:hypothetical protein